MGGFVMKEDEGGKGEGGGVGVRGDRMPIVTC